KQCYRSFHEATGNSALATATCGVCARECSVAEDGIRHINVTDIPNGQRLHPHKPHPSHTLINGMLLESTAVYEDAGPPRYSLANELWIGHQPWVLKQLTFPEQLLIALLYPRVYVFKLFPKRTGAIRDISSMQSAMRGNVSTYDQNIDAIAAMVNGNLMPHPPAILASLITITFVGVGQLPKNWIRSMFRVRRHAVRDALWWLQLNNAKYYGGIEISSARLENLPLDDVPVEICGVMRQSEDTGVIDQENDGYVPQDNDEGLYEKGNPYAEGHRLNLLRAVADVVPLQVSGTIDTDMTTITASEMMAWGLANLWDDGREGGYAVRHGGKPVNDFGRPRKCARKDADGESPTDDNFFEKAYPCLFPYGQGGIERQQAVKIDFAEHVKWLLRYHDRRFRKHETFPYVCFGILQRRQALGSARKMQQAQEEEESHKPVSDPAIRLLRQHLYSTAGRVIGSDQSRYQLRSQIWSTSIMLNPPNVWLTLNPCDLHDPIAQVFAGEHIDMDKLLSTIGPSKEARARNVASDPYAAAKFFHFMIKAILQTLFGITATPHQLIRTKGVLGTISAYFGVVESQGR
ncbi:hypothetical protein PISMIDRAFT_85286, partial [Pisolithus microcarpus 441]